MEKRWEMLQIGKTGLAQRLAAFLILASLGLSGCFSGDATPGAPSGGSGATQKLRPAPEFSLPDAGGHIHKISDFKGSLVLLHFWASWCPPCLGEIPQWVELSSEFKGRKFQMIAVSLDDGWPAALKVLPAEKLPPEVLSLLDAKSAVSDEYGSYAFPETYLINQKGEIITKWIGPQDWKSPAMLKIFEKFLSEGA